MTYDEWIADYHRREGSGYGRCKSACETMRAAFPELTIVPGHVYCAWGRRGHFWLTAPDGTIVDPTREQFPGPVDYDPWKPGDLVDVGACMECGERIWLPAQTLDGPPHNPHSPCCSTACLGAIERAFGVSA